MTAPLVDEADFCSTCCARLELGSLFCAHCRQSFLYQLVHSGLESEDVYFFPLSKKEQDEPCAGCIAH